MKKLLSLLLLTIFSSTLLLGCSGRQLKEGKTYTAKYLKSFEDKTHGFGDLKDNFNQIRIQWMDYSEPFYHSVAVHNIDSFKDEEKIVVDIIKQYKKGRILCGHVEGIKAGPKSMWDEEIKEDAEYYDK